jgi:transketolase
LKFDDFKKNHPERFPNWIAEANMIGIAAGLTIEENFYRNFC